ncbi:MAG: bis(5'-nucleosyl)-tetraphosphatase [Candidatus Helarchaeota archaeon]
MREIKSAGMIIFRRDINDKKLIWYLLLQDSHNHWGFPKGIIEKGETIIETASREVKEEAGLDDIKVINHFLETIEYYYYSNKGKIHKTVTFFLGETKSEEIKISYEHIGFKWVNYIEALNLLSFENARLILKKAHKKINSMIDHFFNRL